MTTWEVIRWWEIRRLLYNAVLFAVGITSIFAMDWFMERALTAGDDPIEPIGLAFGVVLYGIAANLCYTLGWVVELIGRKTDESAARSRTLVNFRIGFWLSCLLTTAPFWFGIVFWLTHRISLK